MAFSNFTNNGFQQLKGELLAELAALGKRHGLEFDVEGGRFDSTSFLMPLAIRAIPAAGQMSHAESEFARYCSRYGLLPEDYGAEFTSGGYRFRLVGIKPSRPKYPLQCERVGDGKVYKWHASIVSQIVASRASRRTTPAPAASAPTHAQPTPQQPANNPFADLAQF